jgi:hypothetical protein
VSVARSWGTIIRAYLTFGAFALWWGGLTFYALVVIPVGQEVLKSHVKVGFITEKVTDRLNALGMFVLGVLLWNVFCSWRASSRPLRWGLGVTWLLAATLHGALFAIHPALERLLDPTAREVLDESKFYGLHRIYLVLTTVQWVSAVSHLFLALVAWQRNDRGGAPPPEGATT